MVKLRLVKRGKIDFTRKLLYLGHIDNPEKDEDVAHENDKQDFETWLVRVLFVLSGAKLIMAILRLLSLLISTLLMINLLYNTLVNLHEDIFEIVVSKFISLTMF